MKNLKRLLMAIALIAIFTFAGCQPKTVTNPATGKTWMDRNLGASQVATSSTDEAAYGNLYQWGRAADGHESRTSGTTTIKATTAIPGSGNSWDGLFIVTELSDFHDWLTNKDNSLWLGASGTNNPCPSGFRLPTEKEWEEEIQSWASNDAAGAFGSPLKLTLGGYRYYVDGSLEGVSNFGYYHSSSSRGGTSSLYVNSISAEVKESFGRDAGHSVRCIKD